MCSLISCMLLTSFANCCILSNSVNCLLLLETESDCRIVDELSLKNIFFRIFKNLFADQINHNFIDREKTFFLNNVMKNLTIEKNKSIL